MDNVSRCACQAPVGAAEFKPTGPEAVKKSPLSGQRGCAVPRLRDAESLGFPASGPA